MPRIFYKGKVSPMLKAGMVFNNVLAWMNGKAGKTEVISQRIKDGYDGAFTDDVTRYDALTQDHYMELAEALLDPVDCRDKVVMDVGCGTGILTQVLLDKGAAKVVCADFSEQMLKQSREKFERLGYAPDRFEYRQADAENLPFEDNTFDLVVSGMVLGIVVNQEKVLAEMHRVIKPGGRLAISTHGSGWYCEIVETLTWCFMRHYFLSMLGSSMGMESWFFPEPTFQRMLKAAAFEDVITRSHRGQLQFENGGAVWDFFAACSSAWFLGYFKDAGTDKAVETIRNYFVKKNLTEVTYDALLGYGRKR